MLVGESSFVARARGSDQVGDCLESVEVLEGRLGERVAIQEEARRGLTVGGSLA